MIKAYFIGRLGAWTGLACYVLMNVGITISAWLDAAPDDLSTVTLKQKLGLAILVVVGGLKTARSYVSQSWGKTIPAENEPQTKG